MTRTFRRLDPERQQAVISAILDEADENGPTSINIKRVAKRAGVSIGSLYQYFNNREGLTRLSPIELCVRLMTDLFNQYRPMLAAMPLRDALAAYLEGGLEWGQTQSGLGAVLCAARPIRVILTLSRKCRASHCQRSMREITHDILTQAAERGEIRADVDLEATARVINALMIAIGDAQLLPYLNTYFQVTDKKMPPERVLEATLELVLARHRRRDPVEAINHHHRTIRRLTVSEILFWLYLTNTVLLIVHEMDSVYWKEWDSVRPGGRGHGISAAPLSAVVPGSVRAGARLPEDIRWTDLFTRHQPGWTGWICHPHFLYSQGPQRVHDAVSLFILWGMLIVSLAQAAVTIYLLRG